MDLSYFFVLLCELRAVAMEKEDMFHLLLKNRQNTPQKHAAPLSCTTTLDMTSIQKQKN